MHYLIDKIITVSRYPVTQLPGKNYFRDLHYCYYSQFNRGSVYVHLIYYFLPVVHRTPSHYREKQTGFPESKKQLG